MSPRKNNESDSQSTNEHLAFWRPFKIFCSIGLILTTIAGTFSNPQSIIKGTAYLRSGDPSYLVSYLFFGTLFWAVILTTISYPFRRILWNRRPSSPETLVAVKADKITHSSGQRLGFLLVGLVLVNQLLDTVLIFIQYADVSFMKFFLVATLLITLSLLAYKNKKRWANITIASALLILSIPFIILYIYGFLVADHSLASELPIELEYLNIKIKFTLIFQVMIAVVLIKNRSIRSIYFKNDAADSPP